MKYLIYLYKESKILLFLSTLFGAMFSIGSLGIISIINKLINNIESADTTLLLKFIGLVVFVLITRFISQALMHNLTQLVICNLREKISRGIVTLDYSKIEKKGLSSLLGNLTHDITNTSTVFTRIPTMIVNLIYLGSCSVYLIFISWRIFLVCLVTISVGLFFYLFALKRANRHFRKAREAFDDLLSLFSDLIYGLKELMTRTPFAQKVFFPELSKTTEAIKKFHVKGMIATSFSNSWFNSLYHLYFLVIFFVITPWLDIPSEVGNTFAIIGFFMMGPISAMMFTLEFFARGKISLEKLDQLDTYIFEHKVKSHTNDDPLAPLPEYKNLSLEGVTHEYYDESDDRFFQLGPLDYHLNAGEVVFIIGGNGSGKSTLIKLLTGIYLPKTGVIKLNGDVVDENHPFNYSDLFSAVFSESHLFRLSPVHSGVSETKIKKYLQILELDKKVTIEDGKFTTLGLSSGQRKRLALLVSFIEDRPIYIFDEWAASQDPVFKRFFYEDILTNLKNKKKTIVVVSHDEEYFQVADRIYKMKDGACLQIGTNQN